MLIRRMCEAGRADFALHDRPAVAGVGESAGACIHGARPGGGERSNYPSEGPRNLNAGGVIGRGRVLLSSSGRCMRIY